LDKYERENNHNKNSRGNVVRLNLDLTWKGLLIAIPVALVVLGASWAGMETYTSRSSFCGGSCHTMTEQYVAWQNDTHNASKNPEGIQANCIDCHFLPGEKYGFKAKYVGLRHLFAYLYDRDAPLPIRPVVKDGACLRSGCHDDGKYEETELQFTENVKFTHKVHLGDKALDGHKLACDSCHFKVTEDKHFEVPKDICFLCHLKLEKPILAKAEVETGGFRRISFADRPQIDFNKGISRCDMCHTIPDKPLQSQAIEGGLLKQSITHKTMKDAGVACEGCHFEVVKGHGEIETGNVVANGCLTCHNRSRELISKANDKTLMHDKHVSATNADCFDCHTVIEHRNRTDHLDFVREDCSLCHEDQHKYQRLLLAGTPVTEDLTATPHLMFNVNTNCMGCHLKKTSSTGHAVRTATGDTCAACHTPEHKKMLDDWQHTVVREVKDVEDVEKEAVNGLAAANGRLDEKDVKKIETMISEGRKFLDIVRFGNGVHNKKYSIMILDQAFGKFEDAIDFIESEG
jgi:nitrate/TMAO reductase-like tetraheme cytochrome c subunit